MRLRYILCLLLFSITLPVTDVHAGVYHPILGSTYSGGRFGYTPFITNIDAYYAMTYVPGQHGDGYTESLNELYLYFWSTAAALIDVNNNTKMNYIYKPWTVYWGNDQPPDIIFWVASKGFAAKTATAELYTRNYKHRSCVVTFNRDKMASMTGKQITAIAIHEIGHCTGLNHHTFTREMMHCLVGCGQYRKACLSTSKYKAAINTMYTEKSFENVYPIVGKFDQECF